MTLWKPLIPLSDRNERTGIDPASAFDPSRTGDPLDPSSERPSIGFGDAGVGVRDGYSDPRRRPIGFAPPEEDGSALRFRTEISLKRHHEGPRASVMPDPSENASAAPWQTPVSELGHSAVDVAAGETTAADTADPTTEPHPPEGDGVVSEGVVSEEASAPDDAFEPRAAEERIPFYKREISFRRKRSAPEERRGAESATESNPSDTELDRPSDSTADEDDETETVETLNPADDVLADVVPMESGGLDTSGADVPHDAPLETPTAVDDVNRISVVDGGAQEEATAADEEGAAADSSTDTASEDASPGSKGRFGTRAGRRPEKSPKRKQARRGKGRRVVGLKIGASQIAAAVVAEADGRRELIELVRRPLAAGIVVDGEVRDQDALVNALKAFFDEEKLPKKDVRIGLASNRIGVRTFDVVGIDDETQFDNAVRFKAHEVLPVAVHESVLDYRVLEERSNEAGEPTRRVLLVIAPRDQVEPYCEVARRAGLRLSAIDLEALGLLRTFVEPKPFAVRAVDDTATVVVAIGHESSTLLVAGGGACEFTRVFDWGGGSLQDAIATELDVHPAEAATILRHLSLSGPGRQLDALDEASRARALDAVRLRLTPFARELVSSLQFYQTQPESLGIGGIVVTGGTSHLEGLGDALHQMIGVNVSVGDPLARVVVGSGVDPSIHANLGSMAVPIGLAIDDIAMRGVNLLPKEAIKTMSRRQTVAAIGVPIAALVPLVAVGMLYLGAHGKATDRQTELDAVQAEIASLPTPTGPEIDASVVGDQAVRATAVASVLGGRVSWDAVFGDMARVLPANVWFKSLSVKEPEPAVLADGTTPAVAAGQSASAPTGVAIDGYTYSQPDVARLLARLATLPSLERVTLTSSATETIGKKDVVRFTIVADLSSTGGAS